MTISVASVSIAARVTLDMHSLNNEGNEGNDTQTRMVHIVGADGRLHHVNGISGDMLKHIQCQHFFTIARQQSLPLCAGCAVFDANRVNADRAWIQQIPATDREAISALLGHCALDDVAGTFITAGGVTGKRAIKRDSVVEFGWGVGIPALVQTEQHFHVKYVAELTREQIQKDAAARTQEGSNLGQAIFYRPASSGIYALTCHLELWRIGFNDSAQIYALGENQRAARAQALVQSILYTLLELNGAMRTSQLPHLVAVQGIMTASQRLDIPAPLISPLAGGADDPQFYIDETQRVASVLGGHDEQATVACTPFTTISECAVHMHKLSEQVGAYVAPSGHGNHG